MGRINMLVGSGVPDCNAAIAERFKKDTGLVVDPDKEITVYDKLAFEADHISMASLPGMYERTVTLNSLGKTFSLTGWKIGWAIAPPHLTWGVRQAHSYLTFATSTPMQSAAAVALRAPDSYYEELRRDYSTKKEILVKGLKDVGFKVFPSSGTYFVVVDHTPFGLDNDIAFSVPALLTTLGNSSMSETRPCCPPDNELDLDLLLAVLPRFGGARSGDFERGDDDLLLDLELAVDLDVDLSLPFLPELSSSIRGAKT
ncbi:unnamed protein product [Linum tenue]|uniref:Aminotransferase class I/classII large domain-containing protein n=1 Tax=Linum tenue TaxID=586396 RepID=A0AAV0LIR5_9ROSI|nr:unnamed protein product [Linum tenue]